MPCHASDLWTASTQSIAAGCAGAAVSFLLERSRQRAWMLCFPKVKHHRRFHALYISKWLIFGLFFFLNNHKSQHLLPGWEPFSSVLSQGRERGCQRLLQVLFLVQQLFTSSIPRGNSGSKRDADAYLSKYRKGVSHHSRCGCSFLFPLGCGLSKGDVAPVVPDTTMGPPWHRLPVHHILTFKLVFGKRLFKSSSYN